MTVRCLVECEEGPYEPGDEVRGTVIVECGGHLESFEVAARLRERTADEFEALAASHSSGCLFSGDVKAGARYHFSIRLPEDAPPEYSSSTASLSWLLEAHVRLSRQDAAWNQLMPLRVGPPGRAQAK